MLNGNILSQLNLDHCLLLYGLFRPPKSASINKSHYIIVTIQFLIQFLCYNAKIIAITICIIFAIVSFANLFVKKMRNIGHWSLVPKKSLSTREEIYGSSEVIAIVNLWSYRTIEASYRKVLPMRVSDLKSSHLSLQHCLPEWSFLATAVHGQKVAHG